MPRSSQRLALARRARAPVTPTPLAAPSATFLARRAPGWPEVGRRPGRQKVSERRPSTGGADRKSPTADRSQLGCRRRVCATGRALRWRTGDIAGRTSFSHRRCASLHPPPGRRWRRRHASRPPAVTTSSRLRRRIPGSPGRHLPAPLSSPTSFRRLRAAPAGSHPPPSPASHLALISQPEAYGRRPAGRVGSNPAGGRSHSGCGSSSGSSSSPRHPAPAPRAAAPRRPPEHLLTPFSPA